MASEVEVVEALIEAGVGEGDYIYQRHHCFSVTGELMFLQHPPCAEEFTVFTALYELREFLSSETRPVR